MPQPPQELIEQQIKDRTRRLIKATGEVIAYSDRLDLAKIEQAIGATTTDTVQLRHLGVPRMVMFVDDGGYETETIDHGMKDTNLGRAHHTELRPTKALRPVNVIATAIYHANCVPGTTHQIVGDVFICPDEDFE